MKGHISTEVCLRTYTHFTLAHDDEGMTYFSLSGKEGVSAINFCETQCRSASFSSALLSCKRSGLNYFSGLLLGCFLRASCSQALSQVIWLPTPQTDSRLKKGDKKFQIRASKKKSRKCPGIVRAEKINGTAMSGEHPTSFPFPPKASCLGKKDQFRKKGGERGATLTASATEEEEEFQALFSFINCKNPLLLFFQLCVLACGKLKRAISTIPFSPLSPPKSRLCLLSVVQWAQIELGSLSFFEPPSVNVASSSSSSLRLFPPGDLLVCQTKFKQKRGDNIFLFLFPRCGFLSDTDHPTKEEPKKTRKARFAINRRGFPPMLCRREGDLISENHCKGDRNQIRFSSS